MSTSSAIALDLGTTVIKSGLLDSSGGLGSIISRPAPKISAQDGRFESDALIYALTVEQVLSDCLKQASGTPHSSLVLGLSSQRSSFLIWERDSGHPVTPLISWQDTRGAASCAALRVSEALIQALTGLRLTPYYFAPKLSVMLRHHPEWRARLVRGEWFVGTLDTFMIWRLTGGREYITDASMAARTLLMDIRRQCWSPTLCELFGIPREILPEIRTSAGINLRLDNGLTLQASLGDQSAALIASVGSSNSEVLVNLGTGGFVVRYINQGAFTQSGYLHTLVHQNAQHQVHFAIEGTLNSLAEALAPYPVAGCHSAELGVGDIFCLTEPNGLGAPYFRDDIGLRFSAPVEQLSLQQIACLLLEGIIFRVARILEDFQGASAIERVYLSGGLSELECMQQGIAQCAPCAVYHLRQKEASLRGAALLAAGITTLHADAAEIPVLANNSLLQEKYRRWQNWFDDLLGLTLQ